jgi:plastocyanin
MRAYDTQKMTRFLALLLLMACSKKQDAPAPTPSSTPSPSAATTSVATGTVAGRVTFKGKVDAAKEVDHPRDPYCEQKHPQEGKVTRVGKDNGLLDVLVRLPPGAAKGDAALAPKAVLHQTGCMYVPRVFGVLAGADIELVNDDKTMHNIHGYVKNTVGDDDTVLNAGQAMGAPPIVKKAPDAPGIIRVKCDVHPWMVSWMIVTDHPFFDATNQEGRFTLKKVPVGTYDLEAIHPLHGNKTVKVNVTANATAAADFTFLETDKAP